MFNKKKAAEQAAAEAEATPITEEIIDEAEELAEELEDIAEEAEEIIEEEAEPTAEELLTAELEKAKDNYLRLAAEYDNFRKRTQREKEAISADVKANTVEQLLPIIDNIELALSYNGADENDIRKGVEIVRQQAFNIFEKLGITAFCEAGDQFDPNLHNCIGMASVEGFESGQITLVIQRGYALGDKIVRPAMVQVAE